MASRIYHLSPNGPRLCRAEKGFCPYAMAGDQHFSSQEEAQTAYEARMASSFGSLETVNRGVSERVRQSQYRRADHIVKEFEELKSAVLDTAYLVKATAPMQVTLSALNMVATAPHRFLQRLERWDAKMQAKTLERRELREARLEERQRKAQAAFEKARLTASQPTPPQKEQSKVLRGIEKASRNPVLKQKTVAVNRVREGDTVDRLTVTKVVAQKGGSVKLLLQDPKTGRFSGCRRYEAGDKVVVRRETKRSLRNRRPRTPIRESVFFQRVQKASELQGEALRALMGVDRQKVTPKRDKRRKPFFTPIIDPSMFLDAQSEEAHSALATVASRRKRGKSKSLV